MAKKEYDTKSLSMSVAQPDDFDFSVHASLKREDFDNDGLFFYHRARYHQYMSTVFEDKGD